MSNFNKNLDNSRYKRFFTVLIIISLFFGILISFSGCFGEDDPRDGIFKGKSNLAVTVKDGKVIRFQVDISYVTFVDVVDLKGEWPIKNNSFFISKKEYRVNGNFQGNDKIVGNLTIKTSGFDWEAVKKK